MSSNKKTRYFFPKKYLPKKLSKRDREIQKKELLKSKKAYKKGKYITRKTLKSYKSKPSKHVVKAKKMYDIPNVLPNRSLARKTGCSLGSLKKIVDKGEGAYYSSGSRPSQTARSWGLARLASAITGGKSSAVDYHILEKGCKKTSKALKLAKKAKRKHGRGTRKVPKTKAYI